MSIDYDGVQVIDLNGASIGKVERTYIDDTNTPRYVEVKFGTILPKHRLIPVEGGDVMDDGRFQAAFDREAIEDSPAAPDTDTLEAADLERIDSYYAEIGHEGDAAAEPSPPTGQADDEGSEEQPGATRRDGSSDRGSRRYRRSSGTRRKPGEKDRGERDPAGQKE